MVGTQFGTRLIEWSW